MSLLLWEINDSLHKDANTSMLCEMSQFPVPEKKVSELLTQLRRKLVLWPSVSEVPVYSHFILLPWACVRIEHNEKEHCKVIPITSSVQVCKMGLPTGNPMVEKFKGFLLPSYGGSRHWLIQEFGSHCHWLCNHWWPTPLGSNGKDLAHNHMDGPS